MSAEEQLIRQLLRLDAKRSNSDSMATWFADFKHASLELESPFDRAVIGGRLSHCAGFAFAGGYQSACESLFAQHRGELASLCVTEAEGNHPRAIQSTLDQTTEGMELNGNKKFVSGAGAAQRLYVACTTGNDNAGRPLLKLVSLAANQQGVEITELPPLGFIPEVSHGKVRFEQVKVDPDQVLPGDGYLAYIKPFRTVEDIHVLGALLAYRLGEGLDARWQAPALEQHISLVLNLRSLANMSPSSPATHLALAGARQQVKTLFDLTDDEFEQGNPTQFKYWQRDKALLKIAGSAHVSRTAKAWQDFEY